MRALLIIALLLQSSSALTCPQDYQMHEGIGCIRFLYRKIHDSLDNFLSTSRSGCAMEGGHLPMIKNMEEEDAYTQLVNANADLHGIFIAMDLVCNATSRRLEWIDGSSIDYTPSIVGYADSIYNLDFDCVSKPDTAAAQPSDYRWTVVQQHAVHDYTVMCVIASAIVPTVPSSTACPPPYQLEHGIGCVKPLHYDIIDTLDDILPESRLECAKDGAHLPIIKSKEQDDNFRKLVAWDTSSFLLALDIICNETTRRLQWIDGSSFDYIPDDVDYDDASIHDLDFDCVSKKEIVVSQPVKSFDRWRVVAYTGKEWSTTVLCVIDCPYCGSTLPPTVTTPLPTPTEDYCTCNPSKIYLDIVFVVDTSDSMTSKAVKDITATIQSTLYGLTFGTGRYQSNVAALAFAENTQTVRNFGDFKSTKDISSFSLPFLRGKSNDMTNAIKQASSMIRTSGRDFTREVIVLFSNSFDQSSNTNDAANAFKEDGGIFITLAYSKGNGIDGLANLASPGYFINDTSLTNPDLDADLLYAFCDANCFCKDDFIPYSEPNSKGREVANGGCYSVADLNAVYEAAKDNCESDNGFVTTVHDDDKNFFVLSLFPPKARYWLGLKRNGGNYEWADGVNDPYTYWSSGNPIVGQDCVYSQQQSGFNTKWFSAPCADPLKNSMAYACQFRPCSSEYDCNV